MGLIGALIGVIAAAFGVLVGLLGAAFGVAIGFLAVLGPLAPVLIVGLLIFWLAGGTKSGAGCAQPGNKR